MKRRAQKPAPPWWWTEIKSLLNRGQVTRLREPRFRDAPDLELALEAGNRHELQTLFMRTPLWRGFLAIRAAERAARTSAPLFTVPSEVMEHQIARHAANELCVSLAWWLKQHRAARRAGVLVKP